MVAAPTTTLHVVEQEDNFEAALLRDEKEVELEKQRDLEQKINRVKVLRTQILRAENLESQNRLSQKSKEMLGNARSELNDLLSDPQVVSFFKQKEEDEKLAKFIKDFKSWRYNGKLQEKWNEEIQEGKFFVYILHWSSDKDRWKAEKVPHGAVFVELKDKKVTILECFGENHWEVGSSWDVSSPKSIPQPIRRYLEDKNIISRLGKKNRRPQKKSKTTNGFIIN